MDNRRKPHTKEHRKKIGLALRGHPSYLLKHKDETRKRISLKMGGSGISGYRAVHLWIESKLGKPRFCEECGVRDLRPRQYNWANIDHKYRRILKDWRRMCVPCHRKHDHERRI